MKVVTVSKMMFNPIPLPGMGRSIEVAGLSDTELSEIKAAFAEQTLYVAFTEEPETNLLVKSLWANPHAAQVTLFV